MAPTFGGPGFLLPTRNGALLRWCLGLGLRIVQPMTLMTTGLYNEPQGAYLASILYLRHASGIGTSAPPAAPQPALPPKMKHVIVLPS